jgi:hypothetical protein
MVAKARRAAVIEPISDSFGLGSWFVSELTVLIFDSLRTICQKIELQSQRCWDRQ